MVTMVERSRRSRKPINYKLDFVEDSDSDEENTVNHVAKSIRKQTLDFRLSAPEGGKASNDNSNNSNYEENAEEASDEEESVSAESSETENSAEEFEQSVDEESDAEEMTMPRRTSRKQATTTSKKPSAPSPRRRPTRRAAATSRRKTYNEDDIEEELYASDGENQAPSRAQRARHCAPVTTDSSSSEEEEFGEFDELFVSIPETIRFLKIETILDSRPSQIYTQAEEEFLVKHDGRSYRKAQWLPGPFVATQRQHLLRNFIKRHQDKMMDRTNSLASIATANGGADNNNDDGGEASNMDIDSTTTATALTGGNGSDLVNGIHPDWLVIDRVFASRSLDDDSVEYCVKWMGMGYAEATWEAEEELLANEMDAAHVEKYHAFNTLPSDILGDDGDEKEKDGNGLKESDATTSSVEGEEYQLALDPDAVPTFLNSRQLRDYQQLSLKWMVSNRYASPAPLNCILGDEMGLGKTAQSISVLEYQRQFGKSKGPFLVMAPLTTLGHWQREIQTWTDMNVVVYSGSGADRQVIQQNELFYSASCFGVEEEEEEEDEEEEEEEEEGPHARGRKRRGGRLPAKKINSNKKQKKEKKPTQPKKFPKIVKPHVILAPYEIVLKDKNVFQNITWDTVIIDEAHRMKGINGATRAVVAGMSIAWLLLLTGTPVQNNMREVYGLLNLLNPTRFNDVDEFLDKFGDERGMTVEQVKAFQKELKPILLRRMKEDVETLPEKEEVIIWVELTAEQRVYYKAIYEGQIATLMAGAAPKNLPNMRNLAMELRKVCCHPYLCNGLEDDINMRRTNADIAIDDRDMIVASSGKMLLLSKLLPKLRREGRKLLIFSQFKIMLDVLEDWIKMEGWPCERIDGSTSSRDRQTAIDRFSKDDTDAFVFLLSTKAGGQGITLTAADTAIIFDSDFNPQNDLQAMARCHRIGQDKEVTIYRLLAKNTYEESVFKISSKKCGLEEAILSGIGAGSVVGDPEADSKKIADLLKRGTHCLGDDLGGGGEQRAATATDAFAAEDIDEILAGRTEKRQIGNRAGNTFSMATFAADQMGGNEETNDPNFWANLLPEAVAAHVAAAAMPKEIILAPRQRKNVNYKETHHGKRRNINDGDQDKDSDYSGGAISDDDGDGNGDSNKRKNPAKRGGRKSRSAWSKAALSKVLNNGLLEFGSGRTARWLEIHGAGDILTKPLEEVEQVEAEMYAFINHAATVLPKAVKTKVRKKPAKQQTGGAEVMGVNGADDDEAEDNVHHGGDMARWNNGSGEEPEEKAEVPFDEILSSWREAQAAAAVANEDEDESAEEKKAALAGATRPAVFDEDMIRAFFDTKELAKETQSLSWGQKLRLNVHHWVAAIAQLNVLHTKMNPLKMFENGELDVLEEEEDYEEIEKRFGSILPKHSTRCIASGLPKWWGDVDTLLLLAGLQEQGYNSVGRTQAVKIANILADPRYNMSHKFRSEQEEEEKEKKKKKKGEKKGDGEEEDKGPEKYPPLNEIGKKKLLNSLVDYIKYLLSCLTDEQGGKEKYIKDWRYIEDKKTDRIAFHREYKVKVECWLKGEKYESLEERRARMQQELWLKQVQEKQREMEEIKRRQIEAVMMSKARYEKEAREEAAAKAAAVAAATPAAAPLNVSRDGGGGTSQPSMKPVTGWLAPSAGAVASGSGAPKAVATAAAGKKKAFKQSTLLFTKLPIVATKKAEEDSDIDIDSDILPSSEEEEEVVVDLVGGVKTTIVGGGEREEIIDLVGEGSD